jgi:hypothetical protein
VHFVLTGFVYYSMQTSFVSLNSIKQLILEMVKCSVLFRTQLLNIVISSQVLFHDGSLLLSKVQYTTVDYN